MDKSLRNTLRNTVTQCRRLLEEAIAELLQGQFGLHLDGQIEDAAGLSHLSEEDREYRAQVLVHLAHIEAGSQTADRRPPTTKKSQSPISREAVTQLIREVAFTHLNRLAAYKMMETRGLIRESVSRGLKSQGFLFYLADHPEDETLWSGGQPERAYRHFLTWLGGTLSQEIGVLFSPDDPANRLLPPQRVLDQTLDRLNSADLAAIWAEDETIGWIYQYFTPKELRDQARSESQAPRNSYELAFRNQFYTPRYVVQFLTDNTLGRIWYEMTQGDTALKEICPYLVRRPIEIFLDDPDEYLPRGCRDWVHQVRRGDFSNLPDDPTEAELAAISLAFNGYDVAERWGGYGDLLSWANDQLHRFEQTGSLPTSSLDLWLILFAFQRGWRIITGSGPASQEFLDLWRRAYLAWKKAIQADNSTLSQEELLRQPVYIPHRKIKDPRELKLLDPACGSMHFGLYAFDLFEVIYEEAWAKGVIAPEDFGYRPASVLLHQTVKVNFQASPISNYSSKPLDFADASVVITRRGDYGDGVEANTPYLVASTTRFRVPFDFKVALAEFDYQQALKTGWFDERAGEEMVRQTGAFLFDELPAVSQDEAWLNFRREIPRLIIEHNLHGIDIDPRAVQIASLALWLRAVSSDKWVVTSDKGSVTSDKGSVTSDKGSVTSDKGSVASDKPLVTRHSSLATRHSPLVTKMNLVCAEPMPGNAALLDEFTADLQPPLLGQLLRAIVGKMELAGEAGSLLKIEEEIDDALAAAKKQWLAGPKPEQLSFFPQEKTPEQLSMFDLTGISDEQFWEEAEGRLLAALRDYAEQADPSLPLGGTEGGRLARRLFADDTARGFAFIDLCRQHFDVVLMNPPFGEGSKPAKAYIEQSYPRSKNDVYAVFVERWLERLISDGRLGAITSRTGFFLSSFRRWREEILLESAWPAVLADLGYGVLDTAMVETAAYCLSAQVNGESLFFRLLADADKAAALRDQTLKVSETFRVSPPTYAVDPVFFRQVPGSPFAYWVSERVRRLFQELPPFEGEGRTVRVGLQTGDDFRFVRCWWEVPPTQIVTGSAGTTPTDFRQQTFTKRWVPFAKGGAFSPYYADLHLVVNWARDGEELRNFDRSVIRNEVSYFYPGLTWAYRTHRLCLQELPPGVVISVRGSGVFADHDTLQTWLGLGNSYILDFLVKVAMGREGHPQFDQGDLKLMPFPNFDDVSREALSQRAIAGLELRKRIETTSEVSSFATLPALLQTTGDSLNQRAEQWANQVAVVTDQLAAHQRQIDDIAFRLYGLEGEDRRAIESGLNQTAASEPALAADDEETNPDNLAEGPVHNSGELTAALLAYGLGCALGRWDIRLALVPGLIPSLADPFAPLPACSPGTLVGPNGLPATPGSIVSEEWLRARPNAITLPSPAAGEGPGVRRSTSARTAGRARRMRTA